MAESWLLEASHVRQVDDELKFGIRENKSDS